jgi:hypothetical protein
VVSYFLYLKLSRLLLNFFYDLILFWKNTHNYF